MKTSTVSLAASACLVASLAWAPAHAALITFVSGNGADVNDCLTPTTACRQISGALSKTDATGTVNVLPGEYDAFTVDKSVAVIAQPGTVTIGNHAAIGVPGGGVASILVLADTIVRIRGFHIYNPAAGIVSIDAEVLHIEDCVIAPGASAFGIDFRVTTADTLELNVLDTVITGDGSAVGGGVVIRPTGSGSAKAVLENVKIRDVPNGIVVEGRNTTGTNAVTIRNTTVGGNAAFGLNAIDSGGGATNVMIEGSTFSNNGSQGVISNGANTTVHMRNSTVTGNARGIIFTASGKLISGGGNLVTGNTVNGVFGSSIAQQ